MDATVTVITPVFTYRESIFETIDSVFMQDYPNIEYILIDDGPHSINELVVNYLKRIEKNNIKCMIIHNNENLGISKTLNIAVSKSTGKYIFNLADDDCFFDDKVIADWTKEFDNSNADIIVARRAIYDSTLSDVMWIDSENNWIEKTQQNGTLFDSMAAYNKIFGCVTAKTRLFLQSDVGKYDPQYKLIEDYPSIMKAIRSGIKIHNFNRITVKYRYGGRSSTEQIDDIYLRESDKIFKNEILPYCDNKIKSYVGYMQWKRNIKKIHKHKP